MKKAFFFLAIISIFSCKSDDNGGITNPTDTFDRQAMLTNWADNIIIPALEDFKIKTFDLSFAGIQFSNDPTFENFQTLKMEWEAAYLTFQAVSMFEIGRTEELRLTNNLNIYPTDTEGLASNAVSGNFNLELPSEIDKQGFPALDYLLFGIETDENAILNFYQNDGNAGAFLTYISSLTERIGTLAALALQDWNDNFRDDFINNSGNSATASVDKLVNDYIFYFERHLRAGKVGIPAGVFSGTALSDKVEAFYRKDLSKELFNHSLNAVQNFFNGIHYNSTASGESMSDYLNYLGTQKDNQNLSEVINNQFDTARNIANLLNDNFALQVETDNIKMLELYDQLQLNVVNLKVDMLQAFNVSIDYVDADGD